MATGYAGAPAQAAPGSGNQNVGFTCFIEHHLEDSVVLCEQVIGAS